MSWSGIKLELTASIAAPLTYKFNHLFWLSPKSNLFVVPGIKLPLIVISPYCTPSILLELITSIDPVPKNNSPHLAYVVPKSNTFVVPGTKPPLIIIFPYPPTPSILLELTIVREAVVTVIVAKVVLVDKVSI